MKHLKILAILFLFSSVAMAQTKDEEGSKTKTTVPAAAMTAFQKDYPGITAKWDEEDADYEASFKKGGIDMSAVYDKTGHRKSTETTVKSSEMPQAAMDYYNKNYSGYKLSETAKIVTDKNVTTYELQVGKGGKFYDLVFDANGKFLSKEEGD